MGVAGRYVKAFAEATHALPIGMPCNADYPFMIPRAQVIDGKVVLDNGIERRECKIKKRGDTEVCELKQSSAYERLFSKPPRKWIFYPFKEES